MERLICLVMGYALGLFQTAYIYGKIKGIDIREHGSGNAGTTNTLRVLGKKAGLIVLLGDIGKCILAVVVVRVFFKETNVNATYVLALYASAGAVLGHNFPFYLKFKGGKGIAATGGLLIAYHPYFLITGIILFFGTLFTTHYVSLGSLLVYAGFLIQMVIMGQLGWFAQLSQGEIYELYIITAGLTIMAYVKHKENIVRLLKGEERKTYLSKKNKEEL